MKALYAILAGYMIVSSACFAGSKSGWNDDYDKTLAKAKTEGRSVLLDFTGSDWCGWCIKLDNEVFTKPAFKRFAKDHLLLVELDYPHGKRLSKKIQEQNAELKIKYGVSGFPTLVLLSPDGKEVKRWSGYSAKFFDELKAALPAETKAIPAP